MSRRGDSFRISIRSGAYAVLMRGDDDDDEHDVRRRRRRRSRFVCEKMREYYQLVRGRSEINALFLFSCSRDKYATKTKLIPVFNENVRQMVLREEIKARKHPGRSCVVAEQLPDDLIKSILRSLKGWIK